MFAPKFQALIFDGSSVVSLYNIPAPAADSNSWVSCPYMAPDGTMDTTNHMKTFQDVNKIMWYCDGISGKWSQTAPATDTASQAPDVTATPDANANADAVATQDAATNADVAATPVPTAAAPANLTVTNGLPYALTGFPESVDKKNVDYAKGIFHSQNPAMSHVLAEPGKLQVDDKFPQSKIDSSGGAIRRNDEGNHGPMRGQVFNLGCEEGGLFYVSVGESHIVTPKFTIDLGHIDGGGWHIYVKCPFPDKKRGTDAGVNFQFTGFRDGYGLYTQFSANPAGGFISANGAQQALDIHQGADSCGSEGCVTTGIVTMDYNTGAITISKYENHKITTVYTNWYK